MRVMDQGQLEQAGGSAQLTFILQTNCFLMNIFSGMKVSYIVIFSQDVLQIEAILDKEKSSNGVGDEFDRDDGVNNQEGSNDGSGVNSLVKHSVLKVE